MNTRKWILLAATSMCAASLSAATDASKIIYEGKCSKCHGPQGDGMGKVGRSMDPKPTDFTADKWQTSVKDADIMEAITNGSKSTKLKIGRKMTPFVARLSKDQIQSLVPVIRGFKKSDGK